MASQQALAVIINATTSLQVLTGIINTTAVPFTSYVPHPRTPLHYVDARLKQLWLVAILLIIPRAPWQLRLGLVAFVVTCTVACLPRRLWRAQMGRLAGLSALLFVMTAVTADQVVLAKGVSTPPDAMLGLPDAAAAPAGYDYFLFKVFCIQVSRFSLSLGVSVASIAFAALQVTSLFLVTTPPERMATAFRWFVAPLRVVGVPVDRLTMMLLLSLRFVSLVFDEVRNLCLGLAARGVRWSALTRDGAITVWLMLINKLFKNLFSRSKYIAESLVARGYAGPEAHHLNIPQLLPSHAAANAGALLLLAALIAGTFVMRRGL